MNIYVRRRIRNGKVQSPELKNTTIHFIREEKKRDRLIEKFLLYSYNCFRCQALLLEYPKSEFDECICRITCHSNDWPVLVKDGTRRS